MYSLMDALVFSSYQIPAMYEKATLGMLECSAVRRSSHFTLRLNELFFVFPSSAVVTHIQHSKTIIKGLWFLLNY